MLIIKLVDARKGLHEKCVELFHNEKVAESIYMYLCDGIEECNEEPSVEPEHKTGCLTGDEIKAIRIHMNAFKERLCNQHRWKEAEEYQQIVDKLDAMLPQPEPYKEDKEC